MYILKLWNGTEDVYVTIEPTLNPLNGDRLVCLAWTTAKAEAVRFATQWHAKAVARARRRQGNRLKIVRVAP